MSTTVTSEGGMPAPIDQLRNAINRMTIEAETLSALILALGHRSGDVELPEAMVGPVETIAAQLTSELATIDVGPLRAVTSLGRAMLLQAAAFAAHPTEPSAWAVTDPVVLQSLGQGSAALGPAVANLVVPRYDGLAERLREPGAAILDVGVGVGALAVMFAELYPAATVLGLDVWEPALELARQSIARHGSAPRVAVRHCDVADLDDTEAFDLAWFAGPFIPEAIVDRGLRRVHDALRPGGVVVYGAFGGPTPLAAALADLRTLRSGGPVLTDGEIERRLRQAGFDQIESVGTEIGLPARLVSGRRSH
jgi:SAM-dependent methyltransferase